MSDNGPGLNATAAQKRARTVYSAANPKPKSQMTLAKAWVKQYLADGPRNVLEMHRDAQAAGYGKLIIGKARRELGCRNENIKAVWWARLPDGEATPNVQVGKESFNDLERNFEACEDQFNVSAEERKRLGIKDNEQVCWERDPKQWERVTGAGNLSSWKANNPGARVITDNGEYIYNGPDAVMCVVPRQLVEERLRIQKEGRYKQGVYQPGCDAIERENAANEAGQKRADDFDTSNDEQMMAKKALNHQIRMSSQSPSSGLSIEQYVQNRGLSEMDILRQETSLALTGSAHDLAHMSDRDIQALFEPDRGGREGQTRGDGGRYASVAPTVRPRNLMSDADRQRLAVR